MKNRAAIPPSLHLTVKLGLYGLLLTLLYASTIQWLVTRDWIRDDFTYAYVIPPVVLYLMWQKRGTPAGAGPQPSWSGLPILGLGLGLFWLGELAGEFYMLYLSLWLLIVSLCWLELGWSRVKTLGFPLVMLLTAFPPPNFIYAKISFCLKLASSALGVEMIRLYGMAAYREGNVIDLGFTQLQVVDACSGLRYLIPLLVLALLLVSFYKASPWKRVLVLLSAVPLSVVTNSLRIALMGILHRSFGPAVAEGFFHGFSGWFIFMFSLGVLLLEMRLLRRVGRRRDAGRAGREDAPPPSAGAQGGRRRARSLMPPQSLAALVLLGATLAVAHGVEFREAVPARVPLNAYPLRLGAWQGERQVMEKRFVDLLDLTDYILADYRNPSGKAVSFYVAYYASQRKGESIHSPATCLPGSGWEFKRAGRRRIPIHASGDAPLAVNRAIIQKGDVKQLAYYWFPQRGRVLTSAYALKLYTFWDALTKQRTDGALVRAITPVYPLEEIESAERRLQGFLSEAVPVLQRHLPGERLRSAGSTRGGGPGASGGYPDVKAAVLGMERRSGARPGPTPVPE